MHVLLRKSPLRRKHFFAWLKTAISSTACGTVTLKSLLPQVFAVSNVYPRPRKRLARCTLDCGFKSSESPALRGFEAERGPITGTSLYLVLKSNGLHRSKNLPVKFGFSPKTAPANIAKKLPPQVPSQTISYHDFQLLAQTPHACFHRQKWVHTRLRQQDRTQRHTRRNRGGLPSLVHSAALCCLRNPFYSTVLYTYISRFSVAPTISNSSISDHLSSRFSTSFTNGPHPLSQMKAGTHSAFGEGLHTAAYTPKQGPSGRGRYHYPRSVPHVHKHPRAGYQNGVLCRFWALVEGNLEERREPAEQRCAHARRCSEASRPRWAAWSVCNLVMLLLFHSVRSTF